MSTTHASHSTRTTPSCHFIICGFRLVAVWETGVRRSGMRLWDLSGAAGCGRIKWLDQATGLIGLQELEKGVLTHPRVQPWGALGFVVNEVCFSLRGDGLLPSLGQLSCSATAQQLEISRQPDPLQSDAHRGVALRLRHYLNVQRGKTARHWRRTLIKGTYLYLFYP